MLSIREQLIVGLGALLLIVLVGFGIHAHGFHRGETVERAGWLKKEVDRKDAIAELVRKHAEHDAALILEFNLKNVKVSDDHEKELAQVRADAAADRAAADRAGGLRIPRAICDRSAAATETAGTGGRDETAAATVQLPREVEDGLWNLASAADEVTSQARACQSWIRANGFYGAGAAP